jgi:hypothetical protein
MVAAPPAPARLGALLLSVGAEGSSLPFFRNWPGQGQISAARLSKHFRPDSHASARECHYCEQLRLANSGLNWRHRPQAFRDTPMRIFIFALLLTFVAPAAFAQPIGAGIPLNQEKEVSPEQREKLRRTEEAYKSTIRTIPDAKPTDPWGNMRGTDTTAAKPKAAPKKTN